MDTGLQPFALKQYPALTVEEQSVKFNELSGVLAPNMTTGSSHFLRQFGAWIRKYTFSHRGVRVLLPPDPSFTIVFPTPLEDLAFVLEIAKQYSHDLTLDSLLSKFQLRFDTCSQSTHTLSGGERALVALAKCYALFPMATTAVFCTPSRWLHTHRRSLISDTLDRCPASAKPAALLYLEGEIGNGTSVYLGSPSASPQPMIVWRLTLNRPTVVFPASEFPAYVPEKRITYVGLSDVLDIPSPTMISGDNGIGKSTFAKMLAGLIPPSDGSARVQCQGFTSVPRLLFQETAHQLLAMKPRSHLNWVYRFDSEKRREAIQVFEAIQSRTASHIASQDSTATIGPDSEPNTLLQAKIALTAERLVCDAKVLILDEPSWGLCQSLANAFLCAVLEQAHEKNVAVLVVSHDTMLPSHLFASELVFSATDHPSEVAISLTLRTQTCH